MIKTLSHLFSPQVSNNYRARILHPKILLLFILFFFSSGILLNLVRHNYPSVLGISSDISIDQLLVLTNQKRQENNLSSLTLNDQLNQAATSKATDMFAKNYWAHIAPDGTTPWVFIKQSGYNYVYAGENLARGYTTSSDVINAWMASPSHRENMLSSRYQNVGFTVQTGSLTGEDTVLVVEMFGSTNLAVENNLTQKTTTQPVSISPTPVVKEAIAIIKSIPTPIPTPNILNAKTLAQSSPTQFKPLVNAQTFSSNIAAITVTIFMFVLILDMIIIERKKIIRFVGHNLDHIFFLCLVLALILVLLKGYVI